MIDLVETIGWTLVFLAIVGGVVAAVAYVVYVLLEGVRAVMGVGLRARWIDVVLGIVVGLVVLVTLGSFLRGGTRSLFSDAASSVSNAPGP